MVMMACPLLGNPVQGRLSVPNSQVSTPLFGHNSIDHVQPVMSLDVGSTLLSGMRSSQRTGDSLVCFFKPMQRVHILILALQGMSSKTFLDMGYILQLVYARLTSKSELTSATRHSNLILRRMLRTCGSKPGATYNC
jgi:hypothetical protein